MKLVSFSLVLFASTIAMAGCCCIGPSSSPSLAVAAETKGNAESIERDYFIKRMTCGGYVVGVKKALSRAGVEKKD